MPIWLWWVFGGVATYYFNVHQQRQAALQSIDVGLLMIKSSSAAAASAVTSRQTIQTNAGPLQSESSVTDNITKQVQQLGPNVLAPDWLSLATAVQSAGYPLLANSIASIAMQLLETGHLSLN